MKRIFSFLFSLAFLGCAQHSVKKTSDVPPPPAPAAPAKSEFKHVSGPDWELDLPSNFNYLLPKTETGRELISGTPDIEKLVLIYKDDLNDEGMPAYVLRMLHDIQNAGQIPLSATKIKWHDKETGHLLWLDPKDAGLSEAWITTNNNKIFILNCILMQAQQEPNFCADLASTVKFK